MPAKRGPRARPASRWTRLTAEMKAIARAVVRHVATCRRCSSGCGPIREYLFKNREELIAYSQAALARAKAAVPDWFGLLPKADVRHRAVSEVPREERAERIQPAGRGRQPPGALLHQRLSGREEEPSRGTSRPRSTRRFRATTCRSRSRSSGRRSIRSAATSSTAATSEGWALYAERLADEMKLYSSDLDRLGMLSSQALRAARLVVDSGMHTHGLDAPAGDRLHARAHGRGRARRRVRSRSLHHLARARRPSYMLGMLEIRTAARRGASRRWGAKFDIKAFHDRVLEDGAVPLTFLGDEDQERGSRAS